MRKSQPSAATLKDVETILDATISAATFQPADATGKLLGLLLIRQDGRNTETGVLLNNQATDRLIGE